MISLEELRERLCDMGYEVDENEENVLTQACVRAEQTIMNTLNCESIPEELRFVFLDMAAGEYLLAVRTRDDKQSEVKSISEGDVSVTFKDKCEEDELIDRLLNCGREEMLSYRRLKW